MLLCNSSGNIRSRNKKTEKVTDENEILVDIGAYCLMPNHFHILIHENIEGGISKYMLKLMTAYTMYFNKKYIRTGKLYEGVFKSTHAKTDRYLKYLYSYIHLNPAKIIDKSWKTNKRKDSSVLLEYIFKYPYSSIREYKDNSFEILNTVPFPVYFKKLNHHKKELFEWLNFSQME